MDKLSAEVSAEIVDNNGKIHKHKIMFSQIIESHVTRNNADGTVEFHIKGFGDIIPE